MLLVVDPDKDFIDIEGVTITSMLSLQPACVNSSELDAPETNRRATDDDPSLSE